MFHFGCRGQGLEVGGNGPGFVGGGGGGSLLINCSFSTVVIIE